MKSAGKRPSGGRGATAIASYVHKVGRELNKNGFDCTLRVPSSSPPGARARCPSSKIPPTSVDGFRYRGSGLINSGGVHIHGLRLARVSQRQCQPFTTSRPFRRFLSMAVRPGATLIDRNSQVSRSSMASGLRLRRKRRRRQNFFPMHFSVGCSLLT